MSRDQNDQDRKVRSPKRLRLNRPGRKFVSFSELRFDKALSKETAQYHHPYSIVLYCWFSAVIFNLGVIYHFLRGQQ